MTDVWVDRSASKLVILPDREPRRFPTDRPAVVARGEPSTFRRDPRDTARHYYYADGDDRGGPIDLGALRALGLTPDTLVWREGMADWRPAGELPELAELFALPSAAAAPPPVPEGRPFAPPPTSPLDGQPRAATPAPRPKRYDDLGRTAPPKTWLVESIVATILCCLPFGFAGIVNASRWSPGVTRATTRAPSTPASRPPSG